MTPGELHRDYIEAQGLYASELQRFAYSSRPNIGPLLAAGAKMEAARKIWMQSRREDNE